VALQSFPGHLLPIPLSLSIPHRRPVCGVVVAMGDSQSSVISTPTSLASLVPPSIISEPPREVLWKGELFVQTQHVANSRKNTESPTWNWGHEYRLQTNIDIKAWRSEV
jgi:hypothetical protein